jgi:hypothetical protein
MNSEVGTKHEQKSARQFYEKDVTDNYADVPNIIRREVEYKMM